MKSSYQKQVPGVRRPRYVPHQDRGYLRNEEETQLREQPCAKYKGTMAKQVLIIKIMNLGRQLSHDEAFTIAHGLQLRLKML